MEDDKGYEGLAYKQENGKDVELKTGICKTRDEAGYRLYKYIRAFNRQKIYLMEFMLIGYGIKFNYLDYFRTNLEESRMNHIVEDQLEEFMIESTARAFLQDTTYVVFGKGGFSKEIVWLMNQLNIPNIRQAVYGEDEVDRDEFLVIGIGDPLLKKQIAEKYKNYSFPNIVAKDCLGEVIMGEGNIICNGNIFTVGIVIGSYNAINLRCTVGHGVR